MSNRPALFLSMTLLAMAWLLPFSQAATLDDNLKAMEDTNNEDGASQKRIATLQNQTQGLVSEYKKLSQGADYQQQYNAEMRDRIAQQQVELASLHQQLADRDITEQRMLPLMNSMADTLEQFVALDLPFHQEERLGRMIKLKQQLASSSFSLPDKYRAVLSAFQQELEYGRSSEGWRGELKLSSAKESNEKLTVEFLRLGRAALYFQTMDGERSGYWDKNTKQWAELPRQYNADIKQGLRIAHNQQAPQMLALPLRLTPAAATTAAKQ
jgi:predicted transcriptional regulator